MTERLLPRAKKIAIQLRRKNTSKAQGMMETDGVKISAFGAGVEAGKKIQPSRVHSILIAVNGCTGDSDLPREEFSRMNEQLKKIKSVAAELAWREAVEPSEETAAKNARFAEISAEWRNSWCDKLEENFQIGLVPHGDSFRQFYLLCRGPKYEPQQARELRKTLDDLGRVYQAKVCRKDGKCYFGEPDLERLMAGSRDPELLLWSWIEWRNAVGEPSRDLFTKMVDLLNIGARNNNYRDIGECWREELEVDDLVGVVEKLYREVKPLYMALHAVVRYRLSRYYGSDLVSLEEGIPAHITGNMWGQSWGSLVDLIIDVPEDQYEAGALKRKNYTVIDLVKRAEDFYISIGFRPMTDETWRNSKFVKNDKNGTVCHGSTVNMFHPNDFRMLLCAEVTTEDFRTIIHELGHIQYYMKYQHLPAIFQDGTNSAFHEAVGDAITYGVMTPIHLQRLGLIQEIDESSGIDLRILLEQALYKLPQIPFALAFEKWRWGVFAGDIPPENYNEAWWFLVEKYQGLKPPVKRSEEFFDPAANFHINDNSPYIRYFLSSVLDIQIFESLCKGAIYGRERINETLPIPSHRCDIYGSKEGAAKLREIMSRGSSIHWSDALEIVTGERTYSTRPLLNYYRPLYKWLIREIKRHNIPIGW